MVHGGYTSCKDTAVPDSRTKLSSLNTGPDENAFRPMKCCSEARTPDAGETTVEGTTLSVMEEQMVKLMKARTGVRRY